MLYITESLKTEKNKLKSKKQQKEVTKWPFVNVLNLYTRSSFLSEKVSG